MRVTDTHIYFWGSFLSNFAWAPFKTTVLGEELEFHTSEQYFMLHKALVFKDVVSYHKILNAPDARAAKALGKKVKDFDPEIWNKVCNKVMFDACYLKFSQNLDFKHNLLDSRDKILVEASPIDKIWGVGLVEDDDRILDEKNWLGQNRLGIILGLVRLELSLKESFKE